jgi:hypothetical protein
MYGLPQAGILAQELLEKQLNNHSYSQNKAVLGLWTHKTQPISFTLVVNDFGVKYIGKEHAMHLISILKQHYKISEDWTSSKYIGSPLIGTTIIAKSIYPCRDIFSKALQ